MKESTSAILHTTYASFFGGEATKAQVDQAAKNYIADATDKDAAIEEVDRILMGNEDAYHIYCNTPNQKPTLPKSTNTKTVAPTAKAKAPAKAKTSTNKKK